MKSLIVNQINWSSSKADIFPSYEISFRTGVCRLSPDELLYGACFKITTSSPHLPSGMDHVMSIIQWRDWKKKKVVRWKCGCGKGAYTVCIMHLSFAPFTSENGLAACELRGKTIKEQPMCHGVEYAGSNALAIRSQGPPSNILRKSFTPVVHHLRPPHSNHGAVRRPPAHHPTRSTIAADSNEALELFWSTNGYATFYACFIIGVKLLSMYVVRDALAAAFFHVLALVSRRHIRWECESSANSVETK